MTDEQDTPKILVIGIGGAGTRIIRQFHRIPGHKVRSIVIDRDPEILTTVSPSFPFVLKSFYFTEPFGFCGGDPDLVERVEGAAHQAFADLGPLLGNPDFCFIVAGLGGNTGTGVVPVLVKALRDKGTLVTVIVTIPFHIEQRRILRAKRVMEELREGAHTIILLDFNRLNAVYLPQLPLPDLFAIMDHCIAFFLRSFCDTMHPDSFISYDPADLRTILGQGTAGTIVTGEYDNTAARHPDFGLRCSFGTVLPGSVTGCIIQITGGCDMCLYETGLLAESLTEGFNPHADIVWGARVKKEMEGRVRWIMIVMGTLTEDDREPVP